MIHSVYLESVGPVDFVLRVHDDRGPVVEVPMSADKVHSLALNMLHALRPSHFIEEAQRGNCPTCQNVRVVQVRRYGQNWNEACPDCRDRPTVPLRTWKEMAS